MTDKSDSSKDPLRWLWRGSVILFASTVLLNLAVSFLRPIMPWLIGGLILGFVLWVAIAIIRWRQARW